MNYRILFLRLLANINIKSLVGVLLGFFVFTIGTAYDDVYLVVAGLLISIMQIWDLYESKD